MNDSLASERNFLGCLLRSPHDFWHVSDMVAPDMLSVAVHRDIYNAITDLSLGGRLVTFPTLLAHLPEEYEEQGPTVGILAALKENAAEAGAAQDYASAISDQAAAQRILSLGEWITKEMRAAKRSPEEVAAAASLRLQEIMAVAAPHRPRPIGAIASAMLEATAKAEGELSGLTTGLTSVDDLVGLILDGDLGFILAAPGHGKSAFAAQLGMHIAKGGRPVLFAQIEMSSEQMGARELAAISGIPVNQIHEGAFDAFAWDQVRSAEKTLGTIPFHVVDADELTVRQIYAQATAMKRSLGLGMVIVDQLDKLKSEGKHRDFFERAAELTKDLKRMAKRLMVPVLVLAQRTRGSQRRDDPVPHIMDADARSIERDADWCLGLWQKLEWLKMNRPDSKAGGEVWDQWEANCRRAEGVAELISLKHRRRRAHQQCVLQFRGEIMRFEEVK